MTYGCSYRKSGDSLITRTATTRYISEKVVIEQLLDALTPISLTDTKYRTIREMFKQIDEEASTRTDTISEGIKAKKARIMKLLDHYEDGILSKEEYLERKDLLHRQLIKLQAESEAQTYGSIESRTAFSNLFEILVNVREYLPSVDDVGDFRKVVNLVYSNLVVRSGKLALLRTELGDLLAEFDETTDLVEVTGIEPVSGKMSLNPTTSVFPDLIL